MVGWSGSSRSTGIEWAHLGGLVADLDVDLGRGALHLLAAGRGADLVLAGDGHLEGDEDLVVLLAHLGRDGLGAHRGEQGDDSGNLGCSETKGKARTAHTTCASEIHASGREEGG